MNVSEVAPSNTGQALLMAQARLLKDGVEQQYESALQLIQSTLEGAAPLAASGDVGTRLHVVA